MQRVLLVRHAEPHIDIERPAAEWALTPRGVASAQRLAAVLMASAPTRIVASPERKAVETARILGGALAIPVDRDDRLSEQGAEAGQFLTDYAEFRALVRSHFDHPDEVVMRQESSHAAGQRFDDVVRAQLASGDHLVIVSHGRIMSSWLAAVTGASAWQVWSELRLPDLLEVDLDAGTFHPVPMSLHGADPADG